MGAVYQAEHGVLGRRAAIKFLNGNLAKLPELVSRFFTEARSVNGIRHPNIVDITDFGQRGTRHYYVMELLEGQTLLDRLFAEGRTDEEATIRIGMQVASALAAAHDKGIVHRDLKPDNIFLCNHPDYPDYVKVFDFGIAKLIAERSSDTHKTRAGSVLGTPLYMSPEQCLGESTLDHRSDIYSLGVVLYNMVTGTVPFPGETLPRIILGHVNEKPAPVREHNDSVSEKLEQCIMRALEKAPGDRQVDMREFRSELKECSADSESVSESVPSVVEPAQAKKGGRRKRRRGGDEAAPEGSEKLIGELNKIILERVESDRLVLPAMPASALKASKALESTNVTFSQVAKILADDPVLAPQLFRRASSAVFGNAAPPKTIDQAISRLGLQQLKTVLVELSAHQVYDSRNRKIRKAFKGIWDHSVAVGVAAKLIAEQSDQVDPQTAHLAGLMHDVGKPIVGGLLLEAEKMLGMKKKDWLSEENWLSVVENSHREVGAAVAKKWQLPDEVIAVVEGCQSYSEAPEDQCANIVRFCNAFAKFAGKACGPYDEEQIEDIVAEGVDVLGLDWVFVHDTLKQHILKAGDPNAAGANATQELK